MQHLDFGRIEGLKVRCGEPAMLEEARIVRDMKLGKGLSTREEASLKDFALNAQVVDLLSLIETIGDGEIECIFVQNGLPFKVTFEDEFLTRNR